MLKRLPEFVDELVAVASEAERIEIFGGMLEKYPETIGVLSLIAADVSTRLVDESAAGKAEPTLPTGFLQILQESLDRVKPVRMALATKFDRHPAEFSPLVVDGINGSKKLAVALTATEGIDLGDPAKPRDTHRSWLNTVRAENSGSFIVTLANGVEVDTREAVTLPLLREIASFNPDIDELVWRTGEKQLLETKQGAPIGHIHNGSVTRQRRWSRYSSRNIRFRPTVVLE